MGGVKCSRGAVAERLLTNGFPPFTEMAALRHLPMIVAGAVTPAPVATPHHRRTRCGCCNQTGHNSRTCPRNVQHPDAAAPAPPARHRLRRCGCCGEFGHDSRTCPKNIQHPDVLSRRMVFGAPGRKMQSIVEARNCVASAEDADARALYKFHSDTHKPPFHHENSRCYGGDSDGNDKDGGDSDDDDDGDDVDDADDDADVDGGGDDDGDGDENDEDDEQDLDGGKEDQDGGEDDDDDARAPVATTPRGTYVEDDKVFPTPELMEVCERLYTLKFRGRHPTTEDEIWDQILKWGTKLRSTFDTSIRDHAIMDMCLAYSIRKMLKTAIQKWMDNVDEIQEKAKKGYEDYIKTAQAEYEEEEKRIAKEEEELQKKMMEMKRRERELNSRRNKIAKRKRRSSTFSPKKKVK